jgi:branched-chain amino acid transport system ATP-binding protein
LLKAVLNTRETQETEANIDREAMELLRILKIDHVRHELTKNLPHGLERLLGVGMVMATGANLILLDEPVTGMNPTEIGEMMGLIRVIREKGSTVLVVEHNMRVIMGLCGRIVALNFGHKIAEGSPKEIRENRDVIEAYLGSQEEHAV